MSRRTAALIWGALATAVGVVELVTLHSRAPGDTLSEQMWTLRAVPLARVLLLSAWTWLTYHFWLLRLPMRRLGWRDLAALAIGALLALLPLTHP